MSHPTAEAYGRYLNLSYAEAVKEIDLITQACLKPLGKGGGRLLKSSHKLLTQPWPFSGPTTNSIIEMHKYKCSKYFFVAAWQQCRCQASCLGNLLAGGRLVGVFGGLLGWRSLQCLRQISVQYLFPAENFGAKSLLFPASMSGSIHSFIV